MKKELFDDEKELKKLNLGRLFVLQKRNIQLLEHYIVNELYDKVDYLETIKDLYVINVIITNKLNDNIKIKNM